MKYWIFEQSSDKLIAITDTVIYNNNPSSVKLREFEEELSIGSIPKKLTGTPIAYLKRIVSRSGTGEATLFYGKDNELTLDFGDNKKDIFEYLKTNTSREAKYIEEAESIFSKLYKPGIGLAIIGFLSLYVYDIASNIELGYSYTVTGGRLSGQATGSLLVGLAEVLGSKELLDWV